MVLTVRMEQNATERKRSAAISFWVDGGIKDKWNEEAARVGLATEAWARQILRWYAGMPCLLECIRPERDPETAVGPGNTQAIVRVSQEERDRIEECASRIGMSASVWTRTVLAREVGVDALLPTVGDAS